MKKEQLIGAILFAGVLIATAWIIFLGISMAAMLSPKGALLVAASDGSSVHVQNGVLQVVHGSAYVTQLSSSVVLGLCLPFTLIVMAAICGSFSLMQRRG